MTSSDASIPPGYEPMPAGSPDGYVAINGPFYIYHRDGVLRMGFRVEKRHTNPLGILHGGMMATYCDMLLPVAAIRSTPELADSFLPTISLQLDYVAAVPLGAWVQGEARVLRLTRSLAFVDGVITADGELAVRASGIFKIGSRKMPGGARPTT